MKDLFGIHCEKPKFGDTIARLHRMTREESQVRNMSTRVIYIFHSLRLLIDLKR